MIVAHLRQVSSIFGTDIGRRTTVPRKRGARQPVGSDSTKSIIVAYTRCTKPLNRLVDDRESAVPQVCYDSCNRDPSCREPSITIAILCTSTMHRASYVLRTLDERPALARFVFADAVPSQTSITPILPPCDARYTASPSQACHLHPQ